MAQLPPVPLDPPPAQLGPNPWADLVPGRRPTLLLRLPTDRRYRLPPRRR
jgi:hypothetical protein